MHFKTRLSTFPTAKKKKKNHYHSLIIQAPEEKKNEYATFILPFSIKQAQNDDMIWNN